MILIVIADLLWRRFDWRRKLRMSTKEIKDELKQVEGDPHIKAKIRELRRQRARKRMMEAVPKASVVIMNPTHYAVALKYERDKSAVPVCVAKGLDLVALKIRQVAEENDVPVIEEPPLARALYASIDIDQPIKPEFYRAVAQIISYILAQNAKRESRARA
jgi:flagellar biosynthesis protein FlhB